MVFSKIGGEGITPGTRGVLAECPGWSPRNAFAGNVVLPSGIPGGLTSRDTWHSRTTSGGILPAWGTSGHVACSEGFRTESHGLGTRGHVALSEGIREEALGVGFGNTWHAPKGFRRRFRRGFRLGLRDTRHTPKENSKGGLSVTFGTRGTFRRAPKEVPKG